MFLQCESRGIPLDIIVDNLHKNGFLIDWIEFYEDSVDAKWNTVTTIKKIENVLNDVCGENYSKEVIKRLKKYIILNNRIKY